MLEGWYCRTLADQAEMMENRNNDDGEHDGNSHQIDADSDSEDGYSQDEIQDDEHEKIDYKAQYRYLKEKLKFLLYENELLQDTQRLNQRRFLKVSRDRSFLLDRLLQYEKPDETSSESNDTESSEDELVKQNKEGKKRKLDTAGSSSTQKTTIKKKRTTQPKQKGKTVPQKTATVCENANTSNNSADGHMTAEEVERHLQSRQSITELVPERAPPTVPNEMFSNEPSLDSESNDQQPETSPSHIGEECISIDNMTVAKYEQI